jgi:hypothetical protein
MSKGSLTPGGKQIYIITCTKEIICFSIPFDGHISDLPCYERGENILNESK